MALCPADLVKVKHLQPQHLPPPTSSLHLSLCSFLTRSLPSPMGGWRWGGKAGQWLSAECLTHSHFLEEASREKEDESCESAADGSSLCVFAVECDFASGCATDVAIHQVNSQPVKAGC
ncbi:hypothetical protein MHYP_G00137900 [Metynnis hypsauchen]